MTRTMTDSDGSRLRRRNDPRRGAIGGIAEIIVAIAVAGVLLAAFALIGRDQAGKIEAQQAAQALRIFREASEIFVRERHQPWALGSTQTFTATELRAAGLLPPDVNPAAPWTNAFGQVHQLHVRVFSDPVSGARRVEGLVVTSGGQVIPRDDLARAAGLAGIDAGYASYNTDPVRAVCGGGAANPTQVAGIGRAFCITPSIFGAPAPVAGTLAALVDTERSDLSNIYLERFANPSGDTTGNTMFTTLFMNGGGTRQRIQDAGYVNAQSLYVGAANNPGNPGNGNITAEGTIQGANVRATANVTADGALISDTLRSRTGGNVTVTNNAGGAGTLTVDTLNVRQINGIGAGSALTLAANTTTTGNAQVNGSQTVLGNQTVGAFLQVNGSAQINGNQTVLASQTVNGNQTIGGFTSAGDLQMRWLGGAVFASAVMRYLPHSSFRVSDGSFVNKPDCRGGEPRIQLTPLLVGQTTGFFPVGWRSYADDFGGSWRVNVQGLQVGGVVGGGQAVALLFCFYP